MNRIIAERDAGGLWTAWFDVLPEEIQVGRSQGEAVRRLLYRTRDRRIPAKDIWIDPAACRDGHLEFVVVTESKQDPCPDCHGSGQYIGLSVIEACQTCQGSGQLS
jgi:hypothetical protein